VRWLWFGILAVVGLDCAAVALAFVFGGDWYSTAVQLSSILAGPLAVGLLVVFVTASVRSKREPPAPAATPPDAERPPARSADSQVPLEVAAGRAAGQAVAALARRPEGQAAIRQTARFVRAIRAAAQAPPASAGADQPERRSGSEPPGR